MVAEVDIDSPVLELQSSSATNSMENKRRTPNTPICNALQSKLFYILIVVICVLITVICFCLTLIYEKESNVTHSVQAWREELSREKSEWFDSGLDELKAALNVKLNTRRAKNVVLFVGDGMGINTMTASRVYKRGEKGTLSWERFSHMGLLKTYGNDKLVPDSASTATALFGGVKANYETSGVDGTVSLADCKQSLNHSHRVDSILKWAQDEEMATGFVTTTRVVHATPSALFAHAADRRWECEAKMKSIDKERGCKDIARQLMEDEPGRSINVIMGGGRQCLVSNVTNSPADPVDTWSCYSTDGRNLIHDWHVDKQQRKLRHAIVQNNSDLNNLNTNNVDYVLGIFANGHLKYDDDRDTGPNGMPSLANMTEKALKILRKNRKGFVLVVEGGLIDQAHHRGWARRALSETAAMDEAVEKTLEILKDELDDTLIIVTADHAHTLSINGYPARGSDILGVVQKSKIDQIPYTTLTYGTGGPASFQMIVDDSGMVHRRDPSLENTSAFDYVQQAAILTDENTHGGSDVTIHARGPMAHLFHRVHEQSYVAHVISYAARIGRFRDNQVVQDLLDVFGY